MDRCFVNFAEGSIVAMQVIGVLGILFSQGTRGLQYLVFEERLCNARRLQTQLERLQYQKRRVYRGSIIFPK